MVALRESVDMLVVVRSLRLAAPFLDVLRGGARRDSVSV
jgi:predicted DNA-binding ribbon-helix-helix protein